jgi:hypothetical protein
MDRKSIENIAKEAISMDMDCFDLLDILCELGVYLTVEQNSVIDDYYKRNNRTGLFV